MPKSELPTVAPSIAGALRVLERKIHNLTFGRRNMPVLKLLRRVLRDAQVVATESANSTKAG